jgi:hypothetical protein
VYSKIFLDEGLAMNREKDKEIENWKSRKMIEKLIGVWLS